MAIDLSTGTDIALKNSTVTAGRFDWDFVTTSIAGKGNPKLTNDKYHAVLTTLYSWKRGRLPGPNEPEQGGYYWDTSGRRGTNLWTVIQDRQSTRSDLIAAADDAGQQLMDEKYVTKFQAEATRKAPGRWALSVQWTTPQGDHKESLSL